VLRLQGGLQEPVSPEGPGPLVSVRARRFRRRSSTFWIAKQMAAIH